MDPAALTEIERWCDLLYKGTPAEQFEAQKRLVPLGESADYITQCQYIIDNSNHGYTLLVGAQSLTRLISAHWTSFTVEQRVKIRNYILSYLAQKGPTLDDFVITGFIQLLCRITKLGWFDDDDSMRQIVTETTKFLQHTVTHCVIGLKILNTLVSEMNHRNQRRTITQHRKIAVSFRDLCLLQTFEMALTMLSQIAARKTALDGVDPAEQQAMEDRLLDHALNLTITCLTFDFIGTNPDESGEEMNTLQVPVTWRERIQDPATPKLFFDLFKGCSTGAIPVGPPGAGGAAAAAAAAAATASAAAGAGSGMLAAGTGGMGGGVALPPPPVAEPTKPFVLSPPRAAQAAQVLVLLVSVRRSLFATDVDRRNFLLCIMTGICDVLRHKHGLNHVDCFHHFCRLLGRLKANYQLSELVRTEGYQDWLTLAADFATNTFRQMHWSPNSVHYVLGLWSRLVAAVPYVRVDAKTDPMLEVYAPKVVDAYISARVALVVPALRGEIDVNDLDLPDRVEEELEQLPGVCRYMYEQSKKSLLGKMDPLLQRYNELLTLQRTAPSEAINAELVVIECQLAWLVYIIGAVTGGQSFGSMATRPGDEFIDADMSRRVFQLMMALDMRLAASAGAAKCDERLEVAMLYYIRNFRKAYLSEQRGMPNPAHAGMDRSHVSVSSKEKLFQSMFERMGMGDHFVLVSKILQKLCNNLRFFPDNPDILSQTLLLMKDLTNAYSSGRLLLKLDTISHLLANHTVEHFPFMSHRDNGSFRTLFYSSLSRLLFLEDTAERFDVFMAPILATLERLASAIHVRNEEVMHTLIGVCRDLRGIVSSTHNRRTYGWVFDALYPRHFPVFVKAMEVWADTPAVTTPLLKFMCEMVFNKTQRVMFDNVSPNGILLFRETSKVLMNYGTRILATPAPPPTEVYSARYKGIAIALSMLSNALDGNYVNFGVFALYDDKALDNALDVSLKLALSVPPNDLMTYPKLSVSYFTFMSVLFRSHLGSISSLPPATFAQLVNTLKDGVDHLTTAISTHSASAIDNLASDFVRNARKDTPAAHALRAQLAANPDLFQHLMGTLFQITVFHDSQNQWSLARALLSVILANTLVRPESFEEYKMALVRTQPPELQPKVLEAFEGLMRDVKRSLEPSNRDRFTQHLSAFRQRVRLFLKL